MDYSCVALARSCMRVENDWNTFTKWHGQDKFQKGKWNKYKKGYKPMLVRTHTYVWKKRKRELMQKDLHIEKNIMDFFGCVLDIMLTPLLSSCYRIMEHCLSSEKPSKKSTTKLVFFFGWKTPRKRRKWFDFFFFYV